MSAFRVFLGILWLLFVLAAHELTSYRPAAAAPAPAPERVLRTGAPKVDLYGNEVFDAVGDYRVDFDGELYEGHAPDTAVLRLSPPGT